MRSTFSLAETGDLSATAHDNGILAKEIHILMRRASHAPRPSTPPDRDRLWGSLVTAPACGGTDPLPVRPHLPAGTYTLEGRTRGSGKVVISENADKSANAVIARSRRGRRTP
jgi:hypothetical protein